MTQRRVVITGLGAICALGHTAPECRDGARAGRSGARRVTQFDPSNLACQIACEVRDWDGSAHFGREAKKLDLFSQYGIVAADEAMKDSGLDISADGKQLFVTDTETGVIYTFENSGLPHPPRMTVEEGGWTLTNVDRLPGAMSARLNPRDGLLYAGTYGTADDAVYRIESNGTATKIADGSDVSGVAVHPLTGDVFFADDESLVDARRMKTLAGLIKDSGLSKRYFLYGRSDTIARNPALLEQWREIGLERVSVGLEFFRDEDLAYIGKGTTSSDNDKAVRILHDLDIDIYASFILRPEFDRADFAALRQYCRQLDLNFASFAVLTPLPGTDLYEEVRGQMITHDYEYFDFNHTLLPTALPLKEFYGEYYRLYREGIPFGKQLSVLKKYPLKEIPPTLVKAYRIYNRLRGAYLDYDNIPRN